MLKGDCYEIAGRIAINGNLKNYPTRNDDGRIVYLEENEYIGTPYLIQAQVEGQGQLEGVNFGHSWIEDDIYVYDFSNGRNLMILKLFYYSVGQIQQKKPLYYKYTFKKARIWMLKDETFGPWQLETESGL